MLLTKIFVTANSVTLQHPNDDTSLLLSVKLPGKIQLEIASVFVYESKAHLFMLCILVKKNSFQVLDWFCLFLWLFYFTSVACRNLNGKDMCTAVKKWPIWTYRTKKDLRKDFDFQPWHQIINQFAQLTLWSIKKPFEQMN